MAIGAGGTFVARCMAANPKHVTEILTAAAGHHGTSFIEIFQNCVIFNDGTFDGVAPKKVRSDRTVELVPGQPMVYGKERDKGLRFEGLSVVACAADEASVWNASGESAAAALLMAEIDRQEDLPVPVGIFRNVEASVYEDDVHAQVREVTEGKGIPTLGELLHAGETWTVG
jgi:2-oxoglutarate ferredoxin oxidoreductase subunit beta